FATEDEARAMAKFYNSNVTASVCGRPVRVSHSMSYPTIQSVQGFVTLFVLCVGQCGSSRVVYIGQIPSSKYSDEAVLKLARAVREILRILQCPQEFQFETMEKAEDAEKMAEDCKANPPKFNGKRLTVYVSRKYRQLKHGHRCPSAAKRENSSTATKSSKHPEEPPAKKAREEKPEEREGEEERLKEEEVKKEEEEEEEEEREEVKKEEEMQSSDVSCGDEKREENSAEKNPEVCDQKLKSCEDVTAEVKQEETQEEQVEEMEPSTNQEGPTEAPPPANDKPSVASLPLPPYDPNTPIGEKDYFSAADYPSSLKNIGLTDDIFVCAGVEHVKMGYYCRVCFLFYSNEDTAKKTHCSSQTHYDKLQKYLEKEQTKAEKKKGKKTTQ
uniref:Matrin 3-like 1.1 n=1 Tax=Lates calcarifer TaxID=8187 RepID=A0A4W6C3G9_LATCA